jgi:hypothetical protein
MSYNLTRSDGVTPLLTLADGQTNSTATSLVLIGKNYAGYGTFLNENFIKVLENFASATAPSNPSVGQLWWQSSTRLLKVYQSSGSWKSISGAQAEASAPTIRTTGDLWFDTTNQQLKVWSGASWITIGPSFTQTTGTSGAVADTIVDDALFTHVAVKFFVQNSLVAILSKDSTYTPGNAIPGFSTIKPGLNLATGTSPGLKYWTTAENADNLGNVAASLYLRSDVSVPITTPLEIRNLNGIYIEEPNGTIDFTLGVASNFVNLNSLVRGNGMKLITKPDNAAGASIDALTVDRFTGLIRVYNDPQDALGIATKNYVDNNISTLAVATNGNLTIIQSQLTTNVAAINSNIGNIQLLRSTGTSPSPNGNVVANILALSANVGPLSAIGVQPVTANVLAVWANIGLFSNLSADQSTITGNIKSLATNVGPMSRLADDATSITANIESFAANVGPLSYLAITPAQSNITANIRSIASNIGAMNLIVGASVTANINAISGNIATLWANVGAAASASEGNVTAMLRSGSRTIQGVFAPDGDSTRDFGNITHKFRDVYTSRIITTASSTISGLTSNANISASASTVGLGNAASRWGTLWGTRFDMLNGGHLHASVTTAGGINLGNSSANGRMGTVYADTFDGTATTAQYADLAERFASDSIYAPGTVVVLGGVKEITAAMEEASEDVFGVISTRPAHLMNSAAGDDSTHPPVAMTGRVPVRVIGRVKKGDRLISAGNGLARAGKRSEITPFNVIGRSLENKITDSEGTVEATVKLNS